MSIKLETANPVRSFKGRGTELVTSQLGDQGRTAAVCASAGNLGWALGWSGSRRGLDVTVVASRHAPAAKLDRIRALGTALGGGAMATGVGYLVKALAPGTEVICVQPRGAPAMTRSWHARRVITTDFADTIADGVAGRFPIREALDDLLQTADDAVLVDEASIVTGLRLLLEHAGLVVEPSAALGVAAILEDPDRFAGRNVVTIVCGGNVDLDAYQRWVHR